VSSLQGLDDLRDDLVTMEMLVYDCHYSFKLTFGALRKMSNLERLQIIMSKVMVICRSDDKINFDSVFSVWFTLFI